MESIKSSTKTDIKMFAIGNKKDLADNRKVEFNELQKFCDDNELNYYDEVSAKDNLNTLNIFKMAAKILYEEHQKNITKSSPSKYLNISNVKVKLHQDSDNSIIHKSLNNNSKDKNKACCYYLTYLLCYH
jgi:GTPase SAR1 family protein